MATLNVTDVDGNQHEIEAKADGTPLMEILRDNDIEMEAICGGVCSCATCHIYVDAAWGDKLPARSEDEYELVSSTEHYQENSRLSCQIPFKEDLDGMKVTIAPEE